MSVGAFFHSLLPLTQPSKEFLAVFSTSQSIGQAQANPRCFSRRVEEVTATLSTLLRNAGEWALPG